MSDLFVEKHREEINLMAHKIYEVRQSYKQPDDPVQNFIRAINIVKRQHQEKGVNNVK
jgi:hypothetical protein